MKKTLHILLAVLLLAGLTATAQIQRGKKPKTELQSKSSSKSDSTKGKKLSGKNGSSHSSSMAQAEKDRIIQQAIEDMVYVKGGTFVMGATSEQGNDTFSFEKPTHKVTLVDYYISKYEVTQELWIAVMGKNPSEFKGNPHRPVDNVSWNDCQKFIAKLNHVTGKRFRLPTEAEWEFAARGGNQSRGYKYSGGSTLSDVAWHEGNSGKSTHSIGQKTPNELGLYDMSGNVEEWCNDLYGHYSNEAQINPLGPDSGSTIRVLRGGCWFGSSVYCRISCRSSDMPSYATKFTGLRLAL